MGRMPRFLADPVPGTGISLWLLIVLAVMVVGVIVVFVGAVSGNKRRQT